MLGVPWRSLRVSGESLEVARGSSGSVGFPRGSLGGRREALGGIWASLGGPWGCLGTSREATEAPRGGPGRFRKHVKFSEGVWEGSRGGPGAILVVWGGPRDRPGMWEC